MRREGGVLPAVGEVAGGVGVGRKLRSPRRADDACDGYDGEEGHLEAGFEEARGGSR